MAAALARTADGGAAKPLFLVGPVKPASSPSTGKADQCLEFQKRREMVLMILQDLVRQDSRHTPSMLQSV